MTRLTRLAVLLLSSIIAVPMLAAPAGAVPAVLVSDDFSSGVLDPAVWSVSDPAGVGEVGFQGVGTSNAGLSLSVPAGANYDAWGVNRGLRVTQVAPDSDLVAEVGFDSLPAVKFQVQGVTVVQDAQNWLRFDVHSTGSALRVYAASTV
ncbi:hypothetical protein, partial [Georgenia subflava]